MITAALVGLQLYLRRSLQARYKGSLDYVFSKIIESGGSIYPLYGPQYVPYYLQKWLAEDTDTEKEGGYPRTSIDETINRFGWEYIGSITEAD